MSIQSVGNQMDIQRAKAEKFVNASDKTIDRLARKNYNKLYSEDDKKFNKRVGTTLKTLPLVAVASGLAMGKGKKGALLSGLSWGMALVAPALVASANKSLVKNNPKLAKAERNNPVTALTANIAASVGAFMGMTSIANTVLANPKFAKVSEKVAGQAGEVLNKVKTPVQTLLKKTKIPGAIAGTMAYAGTLSMPKPVAKVLESPIAKTIGGAIKNVGKSAIKNAPSLLVFGTLGAMLGKAVADTRKYSGIKAEIKDAQFNTAKNLVNAYSAENAELKAENAELAQGKAEEVE